MTDSQSTATPPTQLTEQQTQIVIQQTQYNTNVLINELIHRVATKCFRQCIIDTPAHTGSLGRQFTQQQNQCLRDCAKEAASAL